VLRDGFFAESRATSYGLDSEHLRPYTPPSATVFRGPTRRGLEYLGLGASWAIFDQDLDATKPTWIARFETRLSVAKDMRFDPGQPRNNRAVGLGYHQFVFSSAFSRRFGAIEPYLEGWLMLPVLTADSAYRQPRLSHDGFASAQKRAGAELGVEAILWEDVRTRRRMVLELRGHGELRMSGLAQSEIWEMLAGDRRCAGEAAACRPGIDTDLDQDGRLEPHPGITRSPAYGVFGGDAGINFQFGRHVRLRGLFGLSAQPARLLSDGLSGNDVYDSPGRRFRIEGLHTWHVLADGGLVF
jgi:hypothetical protein